MNVTVKDLLEAGVHFGHQTARWNPKMRRYIFEQRNGIHIIDLQKTMECLWRAYDFVQDLASHGKKILFVGTKKQAKDVLGEAAKRCGMYYVKERWLGGLLTNFVTIRRSVARYKQIEGMIKDGSIENIPQKEAADMRREYTKYHKNLEGIKEMENIPEAIFIIDPKREAIAVNEARKMQVPIVAIADTNCDPDLLNYPIPGNDDSIRTLKLICDLVADAVLEGKKHVVVIPQIPAEPTPSVVKEEKPGRERKAARPKKAAGQEDVGKAKETAKESVTQKTKAIAPKKKEGKKTPDVASAHEQGKKG